jgi:hypothetical protein
MYRATLMSRGRDSRVAAPSSTLLRTCIALTGVALGLAGCSNDAGSGDDAGPVVTAELGTGMFTFERLADGQPLDLISGPQGGFHFVVHARMRGMTPGDPRQPGLPGNPTTFLRALDENGVRIDVPEIRQLGYAPDPQVAGWYALPSGRILLIDNLVARSLYGRPVTIELQIQDSSGRMAADTARITAIAFPPDAGPGRPDPIDAGPDDPGRVDAGPSDAAPSDAAPAGATPGRDSPAGQP